MPQWQLSHLSGHKLDRQVQAYTYFFMVGFASFCTSSMVILINLNDLCLLPAQFCCIIVYIRNEESLVQIADRCAPWNIAIGAENLILQALHLLGVGVCRKFPAGTGISSYLSNQCFMEY
jgi:hypothetical protein